MAKQVEAGAEIFPDESIRQANFDAFEKRYGFRPDIDAKENSKYRAEGIVGAEPVLFIRNAMLGGDLRLNSSYDPFYEAIIWAKGREEEQRKTAMVLCGFSTGVFVRALLKEMRADTEVFVYEPLEALFSFVCSITDLSDLITDKRVHLFVSDRLINTMTDALHKHIVAYKPEISAVVTPFYSKDAGFRQICDEVERLSIALRNFKKSRGRAALRNRLFAWMHLDNARLLSDIEGKLSGVPAVIVSAGPSLNKNVSKLRELKGHAFILATDRALSTLEENQVVPDAVISVDAEKSSDYLEFAYKMNIPVICSYQVNSEIQKKAEGRCIYFDETGYERKLLSGKDSSKGSIDMGGNVAGAAFVALGILGVKNIILVGQDLAYSAGKHHADGIDDGMKEAEDIIEVPGIDGKNVKSNIMWIKYRDYFSRQIKLNQDIRLIDATEGGALIEGSEIKALKDIIDEISDGNNLPEGIFENMPTALDDTGWQKASAILDGWVSELEQIAILTEDLQKVCDELITIINSAGINSDAATDMLRKFDEFRRKLYKLEMNSMLEEFWVEDMYSVPARELYVRTDDEAIRVFEEAGSYYKQLAQDALSLRGEFTLAIKK